MKFWSTVLKALLLLCVVLPTYEMRSETLMSEINDATLIENYVENFLSNKEGTVPHVDTGGNPTAAYGVFDSLGLNRDDYSSDKDFAKAVVQLHINDLRSGPRAKVFDFDALPDSMKYVALDLNYNAGDILKKAPSFAKELGKENYQAALKQSLDVLQGYDPSINRQAIISGLAKRRAAMYNNAAQELGIPKINNVELSDAGSNRVKIDYNNEGGGDVFTFSTSSTPLHSQSKFGTYRPIEDDLITGDTVQPDTEPPDTVNNTVDPAVKTPETSLFERATQAAGEFITEDVPEMAYGAGRAISEAVKENVGEPLFGYKEEVEEGDTLTKIAREQGLTLDELLEMNPQIENPDVIQKGEEVKVGKGLLFEEGGVVPAKEQTDRLLSKENVKDAAMFGAEFIPGVGEALAVKRTSDAIEKGDYLGAGIEAAAGVMGLIPGVGDLAGKGLRTATKAFRKADVEEAEKLLDSPESMKVWQDKNRLPETQRQANPEASQKAAEDLFEGEITSKEARQRIKDAIPDPKEYSAEDMPDMPTVTELTGSLGKKAGKFGVLGVKGFDLEAGQKVSSRLDIPAYNNYDTWVVSIHDGTKDAGSVVGFGQAIRLKDISFGSKSKEALSIARGKRTTPAGEDKPFGKSTIARIFGDYVPEDPYDLQDEARRILASKSPEWTQVGMNPYRGSAFYDKATGSPVFTADEVIQVGPLVLAKNVQKPTMSQLKDMAVRTRDGKLRMFNEGGDVSMQKQMELFDEGGLMQEGGTVDPISGNDVPVGSLQEEVRDDIPAQLSEGEFVMPADVVRYHGLDKMMALRDEAKAGLQRMDAMGQMGNADEATIPDGIPFNMDDLLMEDEPMQMQVGGFVPQLQQYTPMAPQQQTGFVQLQQTAPIEQRFASPYAIQEAAQPTGTQYTAQELLPQIKTEFKTYVNAQGQTLQIPFVDGQPLYPVPPGYTLQSTTAPQTPVQQQPVQAPVQQYREDDPSDDPQAPQGAVAVFGGQKYDLAYDSSKDGAPGLLGVLTGGIDRVTITDGSGRQASMSRDLYNTLKENRNSSYTQETLQKLFSYTDAADQQIRQSAGYERGFFGDNAKELGRSAASEIYEDLGLEYKGQPLAEALMLQDEATREAERFARQQSVTTTAPVAADLGPEYSAAAVDAQVMGDGTTPPITPDGIGTGPLPSATLTTTQPRGEIDMDGTGGIGAMSPGRPATEGDIARLFGQETTAAGTRFDPSGVGFPVGTRLSPVEQRLSDATRMTRLDEPTAPVFADAEVATINRFGRLTDYQKVGDDYFRVKDDGSLARDPASGLTLANLRNPESPLVTRETVSRRTGDEISLPMSKPTAEERRAGTRDEDKVRADTIAAAQREAEERQRELQEQENRERARAAESARLQALADEEERKRQDQLRREDEDKKRAAEIERAQAEAERRQREQRERDQENAREGRGNIVTDSSGRPVTDTSGRAVTTRQGSQEDRSTIEAQADSMRREATREEQESDSDGGGGGTYCCTASWKRNQMTISEIKELRKWHRQQSSMWQEGYDIWGKWVADKLVAKSDWSASVVKGVYEALIQKNYTAKGLFGLAVIIPGVYATALYRRMRNNGRVACTN